MNEDKALAELIRLAISAIENPAGLAGEDRIVLLNNLTQAAWELDWAAARSRKGEVG